MTGKALHHCSTIEISNLITSGEVSSEETVMYFLDRINRLDTEIGAFVYLDAANALTAAKDIDARIRSGETLGPLAGVPFAVKDFTHVQGMPTIEGSRAAGSANLQQADEAIIARLRSAGAIPLGKTNVPEFGMHSATYNERFGVSRNPWDLSKTPGGSSGGSSAAVSAGLVPFATGTDGGGSIRTPAAFCGLVGLKPTNNLIARRKGISNLSCLGFLTTTVADTARLIEVTSAQGSPGFEQLIKESPPNGLRATWSSDFGYAPMGDEEVQIAHRAYNKLIAALSLEETAYQFKPNNVYRAWILDSLNYLKGDLISDGVDIRTLDTRTQALLDTFSLSSAKEQGYVEQEFNKLNKHVEQLFSEVDLLFTPATSCAAFGADQEIPNRIAGKDATWTGAEPLSMFANVAGVPAISIPVGETQNGLPVGLQIVARQNQDHLLLQVAKTWERINPWPPLAPDFR